jgi:hypothetical protein
MDFSTLKMDTAMVYLLVAAIIAYVIFSLCPSTGGSSGSWARQAGFEGFGVALPQNLKRPQSVSSSLLPHASQGFEDWSQYAPKPSAELGGVALLDRPSQVHRAEHTERGQEQQHRHQGGAQRAEEVVSVEQLESHAQRLPDSPLGGSNLKTKRPLPPTLHLGRFRP